MYQHTQRAPMHWILHFFAAYCLVAVWFTRDTPVIAYILLVAGFMFFALGLMFKHLTIRDDGDHLTVAFGPLPLFGKRVRYDDIHSAKRSRSAVIDGWGVHYIPGRGTTYNIWGFDCVELDVKGHTVRIGSNDVENLLAFLRGKIEDHQPA